MNAQFVEHVLGVGEHVHQMRDRRALVTADIGHARLQERLGNGENAFAAKFLAFAEFEILHFAGKRSFRHERLRAEPRSRKAGHCNIYETFPCVLQRLLTPDTHSLDVVEPLRVASPRVGAAGKRMLPKIAEKSPFRQLVGGLL